MNKVYSGYEIELNKEEDKAYKAKILKIEGNSYQETRDEVAGTTVSGDFISISDAQDLPITKFNIEGKSVQETRSGRNKADLSGINKSQISVSYVSNEDGSVKVSGTASADGYIMLKTLAINIPSETYVTMAYGSTKELLKDTDIKAFVWFYDASDNLVGSFNSSTFMMKDKYPTDIVKMTIGVEHMKSGVTYNLDLYIDIEVSETIPTEYEQYGATPSINSEAPIESVGDNIQLFDKDNANILKGYISSSAKQIVLSDNVTDRIVYISCKPNKTYTAKKMSTSRFNLFTCSEVPKTNLSASTYVNTGNNATINTVTSSSNDKYLGIQICSTTAEINNIQEILDSIKISEGTSTGAYSPYGQGSVEIKQVNKNILELYDIAETTKNGLTYSCVNGKIKINGTATKATNIWINDLNIKMNIGKYTLTSNNSLQGKGLVALDNSDGHIIKSNFATPAYLTLNENTTATKFLLQIGLDSTFTNFEMEIQLEKGETATALVPHQSQTKALYTQQPFRGSEDVVDGFVKKMGKWYEQHKIEEIIFNGTEYWENPSNIGEDFLRFHLTRKYKKDSILFCDKLEVVPNSNWKEEKEKIEVDETFVHITIAKSRLTTQDLNGFKNFLNSNNITVYHELETPILIPCTLEQVEALESMRTYEGVNHIYTTDELKPTISLRYNYIPALPSLDAESYTSSVGDNINLFDKDNVKITHKLTQNDNKFVTNTNSNFITINADGSSNAVYENNLKAGDYSISFDIISTKNITLENFYLVTKKSDDTMRNVVVIKSVSLKANEKTRVRGSNKLDSDAIKYGFAGYFKPNFENGTVTISNIKLEKGTKATAYSPYGQGSIEIKQVNKNFLDLTKKPYDENSSLLNGAKVTLNGGVLNVDATNSTGAVTIRSIWADYKSSSTILLPKGTYYTALILNITGVESLNSKQVGGGTFTLEEDCYLTQWFFNVAQGNKSTKVLQIERGEKQTDYVEHQSQTKALYAQQPFRAIGDEKDTFIRKDWIWNEEHKIKRYIFTGNEGWKKSSRTDVNRYYVSNIINTILNASTVDILCSHFKALTSSQSDTGMIGISKYNETGLMVNVDLTNTELDTLDKFKAKLTELYNAGTPVYVDYVLAEPELIPCTPQQSTILDQLENIQLYDGVNYIHTIDEIQPLLTLEIYNMIEDYDLYVSNDGYFGIPGTDIKFLVNFHESNLPTMPEAVEASVRAAGRDGDYVLNTTYEPLPFEIVCYTEDNLTPTQKKEIESKVNRFLNSIKNRTKRIAFEKGEKFYNVKYNGLLTTTNYPAHLKFSIPLKSSESFGKDAYQKVLSGNSTEVSDTVEEVGALITIYGPATLPIIALNDYSMEYDTAILEGARVEIDTAKSTATHINSDGVKTNVMRHYNHQFPKIQPGENTLKVLSGVDDENNVTVKWNDLKL